MSWNVTFLMQIMFIDITRWFMKFGVKRITPVVWTEIQFKFWMWVSTLQATTPQPGPLFIPKQDRKTFFMIHNHPGVWKVYLVNVDFPPFGHPFCWFSWREMGQNRVSGQILLHFAPFLFIYIYMPYIYCQWNCQRFWPTLYVLGGRCMYLCCLHLMAHALYLLIMAYALYLLIMAYALYLLIMAYALYLLIMAYTLFLLTYTSLRTLSSLNGLHTWTTHLHWPTTLPTQALVAAVPGAHPLLDGANTNYQYWKSKEEHHKPQDLD